MGSVAYVQGASRGLGLALARALVDRSDIDVVYAAARAPEDSSGLTELRQRAGARLRPVTADVQSESSIAWAAEKVASEQRALDYLFYVAGVLHEGTMKPEKRFEQVHQSNLEHAFAVNATGPILTARYLVELLAHDRRAVLANISAHAGSIGDNRLGGWYSYRASKAAQNMLTRTLAIELRRRAPNAICVGLDPGTMDTELSRGYRRNVSAGDMASPDEAAARLLALLDSLTREHSGAFLRYDGQELPW